MNGEDLSEFVNGNESNTIYKIMFNSQPSLIIVMVILIMIFAFRPII